MLLMLPIIIKAKRKTRIWAGHQQAYDSDEPCDDGKEDGI